MIKLTLKSSKEIAPWCINCTEYENDIDDLCCGVCAGFLLTRFVCPDCGKSDEFWAYEEPQTCKSCAVNLPFMSDMNENQELRKEYHFAEDDY